MFEDYVSTMQNAFKLIQEAYQEQVKEAQEAQEKVKNWELNAAIQEREDIIAQMHKNSLCLMSDVETERVEAFKNYHYEHCAKPKKLPGSSYIYTLTGTGIGTIIEIECPICHQKEDVTDIESW